MLQLQNTATQNVLCGIILFFTVGIYMAVLGLGAGGGQANSAKMNDISNSVLYAVFGIVCWFAGSVLNTLGPKITLLLGIFGYPFYVASLFYYDRQGGVWFPVLSGVVLGLSAPLLWTTAGMIQFAYSTERERGKYIAVQYLINQSGSAIGSFVAFMIIYKGEETSHGSPTNVYIAFIVLMCVAFVVCAFGIVSPKSVTRSDGTHIAQFQALSYRSEITEALKALHDKRVIFMLPVLFAAELLISLAPDMNDAYFNRRTRAMNSTIYYLLALPSSYYASKLLDTTKLKRKTRGLYLLVILAVFELASFITLIVLECNAAAFTDPDYVQIDWKDSGFAGPFILYMLFSITWSIHQLISWWILGSFTNLPRRLASLGGIYKGVAGIGLVCLFGMGASGDVSLKSRTAFTMAVHFLSVIIMVLLCLFCVPDTNYGKEPSVINPVYVQDIVCESQDVEEVKVAGLSKS